MQVLLSLLNLLNKRIFIYFLLASLIASVFIQQRLKIDKLQKHISYIETQLKEKQTYLKMCKTNEKTLLENIKQKDSVLKQLQQDIKNQKNICQSLLQKKDKLISDLQKLKMTNPKPIKPTVIYKEKCSFKIETGEQLYEKDFIFDTLSNIGK